jgi:hypothetical protein
LPELAGETERNLRHYRLGSVRGTRCTGSILDDW